MKFYWGVLGTIGIIVIVEFVIRILRNNVFKKMNEAVANGDQESFNQLTKNKINTLVVPPYTIEMLKLNMAYIQNDTQEIGIIFDELSHKGLNEKQAMEVWMKAFNYYLSEEDWKKCKEYKERIDKLTHYEAVKRDVDRTYDIVVLHEISYLDELIKENESIDETKRSASEYLIAKIYQNKGDTINSQKYAQLSRKHFYMLNAELNNK